MFKDFADIEPSKFMNVTNGVTVRWWIGIANWNLAKLYQDSLGTSDFYINFEMIKELLPKAEESSFRAKWSKIKNQSKKVVVDWVFKNYKIKICETAIFDVMIKRFHEYKR